MSSTTINTMILSDLTERFPTSEALFAWLRSDEGGRLVIREDWMTPEEQLVLIHYKKGVSDLDAPHVGEFRSVVWDARTNRPVCAGPARGLSFAKAIADGIKIDECVVEDFIDGVMINLFQSKHGGEWDVATRTVIGGECNFYGKRDFSDLFWETFDATGLSTDMLEDGANYSFVLQHPEERVVVSPAYGIPKLYLVAYSGGSLDGKLQALFPQKHFDLKTLEDVKERVVAWGKRFRTAWQGLVIKTADGRRYKLRSDQYDEARHLRGNQANRPYVWLERWGQGRLPAYLRLYPEEQTEADAVIQSFKDLTQQAHTIYLEIYKQRLYPLGQAPAKFRKLLWDAHTAGKASYFPHFREFTNGLDTARKLWLVNFDRRFAADPVAAV
jgi:hypothetical protein